MKIQKLHCAVQCYDWGCVGESSLVANLKKSADSNFIIEKKPYAEMWMGTHRNGPSSICSTNMPLAEYISINKTSLAEHENGNIGFLFKVLSVNKPLSIQSHPNKEEAKVLHARDPTHYPDDNHKPEMAIALSDFELLCGFRPSKEIYDNIKKFPEFSTLIKDISCIERLTDSNEEKQREALKIIFSDMMNSATDVISTAINSMVERLKTKGTHSSFDKLLIRLNCEFPNDIGVFAPLLLNYFTLKKGESVFLEPNQPHAYLLGDCVECMACSDNTIRAGLTPKFKDVKTLISSLSFKMSPPPYFLAKKLRPGLVEYRPPVKEFAVHEIKHDFDGSTDIGSSSILIVIDGKAKFVADKEEIFVNKGEVVFLPNNAFVSSIVSSENFLAYRAFTPLQ